MKQNEQWQLLDKQEKELSDKEYTLQKQQHHVKKVQEDYEMHFSEAYHLLDDLRCMFHNSDSELFFEATLDEFSVESKKALSFLEDEQQELTRERRRVQDNMDDILQEKRIAALTEDKEANNEY